MFLVHRAVHRFEHTADLRSRTGIRVDTSSLEHAFESLFYHVAETLGETIVRDFKDQFFSGVFRQCNEHRDLKQHLAFALEPATGGGRSVPYLLLVLLVPGAVILLALVSPVERAGLRLEAFAEFDATHLRFTLFVAVTGYVNDVTVGAVNERGATGEASGQDVHFEIPFDDFRRHTRMQRDIRTHDVVIPFVLRLDLVDRFVPDGGKEVEKAERVHTDELGEFRGEDGVLVVLLWSSVSHERLPARKLLPGHFQGHGFFRGLGRRDGTDLG